MANSSYCTLISLAGMGELGKKTTFFLEHSGFIAGIVRDEENEEFK